MRKLLFLISISTHLLSQDKLGYIGSTYAGVSSIYSNPTNLLNSKIFVDINIVGAGLFIENNLVYFPKKKFSPVFKQFTDPVQNLKEVTKRGFLNLKIEGPSVGVSFDNFSFGFFVNGRVMGAAKVSKDLATLAIKNSSQNNFIGKSVKNQNAFFSAGAWVEFGLNAAYMYRRNHYSFRNVGVNLKYLVGIIHTDIRLNDLDYDITNDNTLDNVRVKAAYKFNEPNWNAGKGFAVDLGWSYSRMLDPVSNYYPNNKKANGCKHIDYKFKFGVSITDLGFINYKKNASVKKVEYEDGGINLDSSKINSVESFDTEISNAGNGLKVKSKNRFIAIMPVGLSAQYDYNFENKFYLNSIIIIGPYIFGNVKRPDMLATTIRYDRKYFGAAIPLSLYDWRYPQLGFSLRFGTNFIIGTDRAGFIFGKVRDTYGADIYFNLKIALFKHCGAKKRGMKSIYDCIRKDKGLLFD
ncbi:MAG: DUF5723 family protein [Bacteroidia bacterium]|nr:DUF5723 family protein [Bacteroidia bacterium]